MAESQKIAPDAETGAEVWHVRGHGCKVIRVNELGLPSIHRVSHGSQARVQQPKISHQQGHLIAAALPVDMQHPVNVHSLPCLTLPGLQPAAYEQVTLTWPKPQVLNPQLCGLWVGLTGQGCAPQALDAEGSGSSRCSSLDELTHAHLAILHSDGGVGQVFCVPTVQGQRRVSCVRH